MRLVRVPSITNSVRLMNADAITDIVMYPCPDDTAYHEVSVSFGESYSEFRFRNVEDARQMIAELAGKDLESMRELLT